MQASKKLLNAAAVNSASATKLIARNMRNSALALSKKDVITHTGQEWDVSDPRMARFLNTPKQVNDQWAVNLIKEVPPKPVNGRVAVCEGGPSEALGHPKIYINLDENGPHSCIYCGLRYYMDNSHH